jgi:hypothetical protein
MRESYGRGGESPSAVLPTQFVCSVGQFCDGGDPPMSVVYYLPHLEQQIPTPPTRDTSPGGPAGFFL